MTRENEIVVQPIEVLGSEEVTSQPLADWVRISHFKVTVNKLTKITARFYANSYQQLPVEIEIEALDANDVVVKLTGEQLSSIKLIDYVTGAPIEGVYTTHDPRFVYQWDPLGGNGEPLDGAAELESRSPSVNAQVITFYLATMTPSTRKVAAEIVSPSGGVFRTNTDLAELPPGKFDSWVNARGIERIRYDNSHLSMEMVNEVNNSHWDVDLYYIKFVETGLNIVMSTHLDVDGNEPHHSGVKGVLQARFHIAFKCGPQFTMTYEGGGGMPGCSFQVNKRPGQATAARCRVDRMRHYDLRGGHACVWYINQHGNMARCSLGNTSDDDYNTIRLEGAWHG